jgi:N-acyl homoserine lactone hydrolase
MKGLEFAIIHNGWGENDAGYNFLGYNFGTVDNKQRERAWMRFPIFCILIKHPDAGYIMFDCGPGPGEEIDRRPKEYRDINPMIIKREEYIDERLRQLGLSVNDISSIIISHCHWDHIGGLEFFKNTKAIKNVYVNGKNFAYGLTATHKSSKGYTDGLYFKQNIDVEGAEYKLLDEDIELFPGVSLMMFGGHTPGVMGLMLELESGMYIFPSDEITASICFYEPAIKPGNIYDSLSFDRSLKKLRELQKKYNATMIFSHDPWQFPTYKVSPEFYK